MTPCEEFDRWMESIGNNYLNDSGIVFNRTPEIIFVDSPWPDHGKADIISIILLCLDGKELFELLEIESVNDLEKVQPETLLNLFYAGQAMVLCTNANRESLNFQKGQNNTMIALIDGKDLGFEVTEQLVLPGDFIRYTNDYFLFMKQYNKNKSKRKK